MTILKCNKKFLLIIFIETSRKQKLIFEISLIKLNLKNPAIFLSERTKQNEFLR